MDLELLNAEGNLVRVAVSGRVSRRLAPTPCDPLTNLCGDGIYGRKVLLSLAGASYIDSTGVGWLLATNKKFRSRGGMLVIHSATPYRNQILKLMRMELVLRIADDESAARGFGGNGFPRATRIRRWPCIRYAGCCEE